MIISPSGVLGTRSVELKISIGVGRTLVVRILGCCAHMFVTSYCPFLSDKIIFTMTILSLFLDNSVLLDDVSRVHLFWKQQF